jgi:tetratricopeptide (TPR) repeat protein
LAALWAGPASAADVVSRHLYDGDLRSAIEAARMQAVATGDNLDHHELYIDLLLSSGQQGRVVAMYTERVRANPEDPNAHYLLGRAQVDAAAARASYERALRLNPDHARSHMGIAAVHAAGGLVRDAASAYQAAVHRDTSLGEAWLGLARVLIQAGESGMALQVALQGLEAVPDEGGLALTVALLDPASARAVLERASELASGDARVSTRLAEILLADGEADHARVMAQRALNIDPGASDAARVLVYSDAIGKAQLDLEGLRALFEARDLSRTDPAAGLTALDALATTYPKAALVFLARAEAADRNAQPDLALESLTLALQRDPELVDSQAAFGLALARAGRHEEAIPWLVKALTQRPWDHGLLVRLGQSFRASERNAEAVTSLRAAHQARPWDVATRIALGEAMQSVGDKEGAYALMRDGLRERADPNLAVAFVLAATAAGHQDTAAAFLDDLAGSSGNRGLKQLAAKLRQD